MKNSIERKWVFLFAVWIFASCETETPSVSQSEKPGLYGVTGWNGQRDYNTGEVNGVDIDGTVGHPLTVYGCTARTVPANVGWSASHRIISGQLPPGMDFASGGSQIEGIPTERGHWIVTVELYNLQLDNNPGSYYNGFKQQLRFHITGSGAVNE